MRIIHLIFSTLIGLSVISSAFAADISTSVPVKPMASTAQDAIKTTGKHKAEKTGNVNINTADAKHISSALNGIGLKRAQTIVDYRTKNGPFKTVDDLTKIKGVSKKVLERNQGKILL